MNRIMSICGSHSMKAKTIMRLRGVVMRYLWRMIKGILCEQGLHLTGSFKDKWVCHNRWWEQRQATQIKTGNSAQSSPYHPVLEKKEICFIYLKGLVLEKWERGWESDIVFVVLLPKWISAGQAEARTLELQPGLPQECRRLGTWTTFHDELGWKQGHQLNQRSHEMPQSCKPHVSHKVSPNSPCFYNRKEGRSIGIAGNRAWTLIDDTIEEGRGPSREFKWYQFVF